MAMSKSQRLKAMRSGVKESEIGVNLLTSPIALEENDVSPVNDPVKEVAPIKEPVKAEPKLATKVPVIEEQVKEPVEDKPSLSTREPSKIVENSDNNAKKEEAVPEILNNENVSSSAKETASIPAKINKDSEEENDHYLELKEYDLNMMITWGSVINEEIIDDYEYYVAIKGINRYDLINSIIDSHIEWEKNHPGFPDRDFVINNIRNKKPKNERRENTRDNTFLLLPDRRDYVKTRAKMYGMTMRGFLEYVIPLYVKI